MNCRFWLKEGWFIDSWHAMPSWRAACVLVSLAMVGPWCLEASVKQGIPCLLANGFSEHARLLTTESDVHHSLAEVLRACQATESLSSCHLRV